MFQKGQTGPYGLDASRRYMLILWLFSVCSCCFAQDTAANRSLALEQAISLAKSQSPDARIATNRLKNQYWQYRFYQSNYLPQLRLEGTIPNYNRAIVPIIQPDGSQEFREVSLSTVNANLSVLQNIGFTGGQVYAGGFFQRIDNFSPVTSTQYSGNPRIGINQPLFRFNQLLWDRRIQPLLYKEAQHTYWETVEKIAVDVTDLYFVALLAQTSLEIARTNVANNDTLYQISEQRFNLGKIAQNELLQLELTLLTAQQRLAQAQLDFEKGILQLKVIIGLTGNTEVRLAVPERIPQFDVDAEMALEQARSNRPQTVGFERRLTEAKSKVAEARGETGLDANLQLNLGVTQQAATLGGVFLRPQDQQGATLSFAIPIVDWGRTRARIRTAKANEDLETALVQQQRVNFEQAVYLQAKQFGVVRQQVVIARKSDAIGGQRYELTKNRYQIGKITITDLTIAQQEKDAAKQGYVTALQGFWQAYYQLRRLTLYDFEKRQVLMDNLDPLMMP